jgi:hypothetical protein
MVSSLDIQMQNEIPQGQTAMATISGNFLDPITKNNIKFYRGYIQTSFDYDIGKIGNTYYIYFQTISKPQNNYSINISGVRYSVGAQISNEPISKQFSVNDQNADFKINKGFVITEGNFSITVQNLNPESITINIETETNSGSTEGFFDFLFKNQKITQTPKSVNLLSGEIEEIDIVLEDITETTTRTITLSSENTEYKIPAYVTITNLPEEEQNQTETDQNETQNGEDTQNEENETITENEDNETIIENKTEEESKKFWDIFKKENKTEEETGDNKENDTKKGNSLKTCAQQNGTICKVNVEICDGTTIDAQDDQCCIGQCVEKERNKNSKIIGWSLIGIVIILILWFRAKYKKTKTRKFSLPGIDRKLR